jgi:hypothetical protein
MQKVQIDLFEMETVNPAKKWFADQGFTLPLSLLIILDSFLQSGTIPRSLQGRVDQRMPVEGGDERAWIGEYVRVRHEWYSDKVPGVLMAR